MDGYIDLVFDIFDDINQSASVLKHLTVAQLIDEIITEFPGLDAALKDLYSLELPGAGRVLEGPRSLFDQGVQSGDHLVFGWARPDLQGQKKPFAGDKRLILRETKNGAQFAVEWQPALIGRPDIEQSHNALLAVNVEWLPNGRRVSRRHAEITENRGIYYIESQAPQNPTSVNERVLERGEKQHLKSGDVIELGYSGIQMVVNISKRAAEASA